MNDERREISPGDEGDIRDPGPLGNLAPDELLIAAEQEGMRPDATWEQHPPAAQELAEFWRTLSDNDSDD